MYNGINPIAVHLAVTSPNRVNIGNVGLRCEAGPRFAIADIQFDRLTTENRA
jgi:hypothetical protein